MTTFIKTDVPMTSPLPGTRRGAGTTLYRSVFDVDDKPDIVGGQTSSGPGLTVGTWEGTANAVAVSNKCIVRGTASATWSVGLILDDTGAQISLDVIALPTTAFLYLDIFRASLTGTPDCYRLHLNSSGYGQLAYRQGGTVEYLGGYFSYAPGDRVGVRWVGGVLEAIVNERIASSVLHNAVLPRGYAAISGASTTTGFILDNVDVDTY